MLACATGHVWNDSDAGGVFKTSDGGKTWTRVLAGANPSTGCGMLAASPKNPSTIYASMWDFRRQGWTFRSGGPGSGIYRSDDGGDHWTELTAANSKGLPAKPWGRIALAVAPSKPQVVYAMIESKDSALFRSDDGGQSWKRLGRQPVHDLAAVLFRQPHRRSGEREQALQAGSCNCCSA